MLVCARGSRRYLSCSIQRLNEWVRYKLYNKMLARLNIKYFSQDDQKDSKKSSWYNRAKPDPTRPRYEDPGQNFFKPYKEFREEKREQLLSGDNKRKVPLKALVPEEYRGARYYTDAHMEVVDPKNVKPKVFMGPYSIVLPHRLEKFLYSSLSRFEETGEWSIQEIEFCAIKLSKTHQKLEHL